MAHGQSYKSMIIRFEDPILARGASSLLFSAPSFHFSFTFDSFSFNCFACFNTWQASVFHPFQLHVLRLCSFGCMFLITVAFTYFAYLPIHFTLNEHVLFVEFANLFSCG